MIQISIPCPKRTRIKSTNTKNPPILTTLISATDSLIKTNLEAPKLPSEGISMSKADSSMHPLIQLRRTAMTPIMPTIRSMTFQEADSAGLHSRGLILEYQGKTFNLNAGTRDTVHVFTSSIFLYVLTINRPLGYIGLDADRKSTRLN